jgi:hypothetical protein
MAQALMIRRDLYLELGGFDQYTAPLEDRAFGVRLIAAGHEIHFFAESLSNPTTILTGPSGPLTLLDAFEGRPQLIAHHFMWHKGHPAQEQCQSYTCVTAHMDELSYFHARDVTFAVFAQGPYKESVRYRNFMGWQMPWYSALGSLETLLAGRKIGGMHLACYVRRGSRVYETYWTTSRGVEVNSYHLLDLTVHGRQEKHEDSPSGWLQACAPGELRLMAVLSRSGLESKQDDAMI